ncbi:MAG TPA: DUF4476 domain-containing protein [Puia sp.]|nr:DUF4476 domain-containing protein [Puia sp.]
MSKFGLVIVLILMAFNNYAQDYFVLIQADNRSPFYVRLGNQVYSSSPGGHLILSQLKDSTYGLTIGLPGQSIPEQRYTLNIHRKDQEFGLKDQGEKGVSLYDVQTGEARAPELPMGGGEEVRSAGIKKDDAFSRLMAGVVHDTSVLYNTYAMEQVLRDSVVAVSSPEGDSAARVSGASVPDSLTRPGDSSAVNPAGVLVSNPPVTAVPSAINPDTAVIANSAEGVAAHPKSDTQALVKPLYRPRVVKLSERKLARSVRLAYADHSAGKKADTIIIFIPVDTLAVTKGGQKPSRAADTTRMAFPRGHGPNPDSPIVGPGQNIPSRPGIPANETLRPRPADTPRKSSVSRPSLPFVNSDCHNYATDYDVDKLRVKLLEGTKDEDRVLAARKVFKTRCFSTSQIRALSEVFTTDAAKFRFFEVAYPFCSDDRFRELSSLLADPVYSSKFRVMTEHQ